MPIDAMKNLDEFTDSIDVKRYIQKDWGMVFIKTGEWLLWIWPKEYTELKTTRKLNNLSTETANQLLVAINMTLDRTNAKRSAVEGERTAKVGDYLIHKNLFEELKLHIETGVEKDGLQYSPQAIHDIITALKRPSQRQEEIDNFSEFVEYIEKNGVSDEREYDRRHNRIQKYFPQSLGLPNMIGTDYFWWFSTEQYLIREGQVIDLHTRMIAAYQESEGDDSYRWADHD